MRFRLGFVSLLALAMLLFTNVTAAPCEVDADCDDGIECNGVETCGYDGTCHGGFGACVAPSASGVHRMEMTGETWRSNSPWLSEIELIVDPPATLAHRVTLEGLTFEGDPIAD